MEIGKQYLYENLNIKDDMEIREDISRTEKQVEPPTKDKVWEILRILKNNKSAAESNISVELIHYWKKFSH
jgi:hypothetical protein